MANGQHDIPYNVGVMTDVGSPSRIRILLPHIANQIAAGEVIERPASVAKELLENSLDAAATQIDIAVEHGGVHLIRVRDNGAGIHRDDLLLALSRHATSKIALPEDLERVSTLGFRGEALPSIGSVSHLSLVSRTKEDEMGWAVNAEGEKAPTASEPRPHPLGTMVEVRDLFFNTPARRRFLRSEKTEFLHLHGLVKRIALSRFDVGISLHHDQRPVLNVRPAKSDEEKDRRLTSLFGAAFLGCARRIDYQAAGLRVWGWLGLPAAARSQTDMQYVYLNGRIIRDKRINHALRQAYDDLLYPGRHPVYVLYLEVDPSCVDVNVHPTKHEVRFRDPRTVHDFLYGRLHQALSECSPLISADGGESLPPWPVARATGAHARWAAHGRWPHPPPGALVQDRIRHHSIASETVVAEASASRAAKQAPPPPLGWALAQLHSKYLIAETRLGITLVDIQAAQARIAFARLKAAYESGPVRSRPLLLPVGIVVAETMIDLAVEFASDLARVGLVVDRVGPDRLMVREVPALLVRANVEALVRDVLAVTADHSRDGNANAFPQSLLATLAAHAHDEPSGHLDLAELNVLLRDLEQVDAHAEESHEGVVWRELSLEALDALLRRRK